MAQRGTASMRACPERFLIEFKGNSDALVCTSLINDEQLRSWPCRGQRGVHKGLQTEMGMDPTILDRSCRGGVRA